MEDTNTSTSSTPTESVASTAPETSASTPSQPETPAATWTDAFRMAGVTGDPQQTEAADPTHAPAIAEPDAPAESTAPSAKGPIPLDRHEAILQNTRQKTAEEVVSRVQQQYGPAIQLQQRLTSDPIGTLTQLIDEAVQHPEFGQHVVSQLARTLASRRKSQPDLTPIETEVGKVYTAEQVEAIVAQQVAQRVQPLEQERQSRVAREEAAKHRAETLSQVRSALSHWENKPGFKEHEAEIVERQKAYWSRGMHPFNALGLAYQDIYESKIVPQLKADTTKTFVQQAAQKAAASSHDPGRVAPVLPGRPKSWDEAFRQVGLRS